MIKNIDELVQRVLMTLEWLERRSVELMDPTLPQTPDPTGRIRLLESKEFLVQYQMLIGPVNEVAKDIEDAHGVSVLPETDRLLKIRNELLDRFSPMDAAEYAAFRAKGPESRERLRSLGWLGDPNVFIRDTRALVSK